MGIFLSFLMICLLLLLTNLEISKILKGEYDIIQIDNIQYNNAVNDSIELNTTGAIESGMKFN